MKQRVYITFVLAAATIVGGCASQPALPTQATSTSDGPAIRLPGAGAEHARLLAMGMARSNGWRIIETSDSRLLLERPLPLDSPQAQMLNPEGMLSAPKLQVESRFSEPGSDVVVRLAAYVITNPGTDAERRIEYTSDYETSLLLSLNALANAWIDNRNRIAAEIPLPPDPDGVVIAEADAEAEAGANDGGNSLSDASTDPADTGLTDTGAASTAASVARAGSSSGASDTAAAADTQPAATTPIALQQPQLRRPRSQVRDQYATTSPAPAVSNEMLALDGTTARGLWASYAEASARERGCEIGERGVVLLNAAPTDELYEVQCTNRARMLLSCQGGICRANP